MKNTLTASEQVLHLSELSSLTDFATQQQYAKRCETAFKQEIAKIVSDFLGLDRETAASDQTATKPTAKLLLISGPSSSGKTSAAQLMAAAFEERGKKSLIISLDDYYRPDFNYEALHGLPNYESLDSIDIPLLANDIKQLLAGKAVHLPSFVFTLRDRRFAEQAVALAEDNILIVEGLHALADELLKLFAGESYRTLFVMPNTSLLIQPGLELDAVELRQLRRLGRDYRHRGSLPLATLDYWPLLTYSENAVIKKYFANAAYYLNTCLPYEFTLYRASCADLLAADLAAIAAGTYQRSCYLAGLASDKVLANAEEAVNKAKLLLEKLTYLPIWSNTLVPANSLLNEFIK